MNAEKNVWLVEKSGGIRQVWGPYTEAAARKQAGVRHFVAAGSSSLLRNGNKILEGVLVVALQAGTIREI